MNRLTMALGRWILPAAFLGAALLLYARRVNAADHYWVSSSLYLSNSGCQYDSSGRFIWAWNFGYFNVGCNAATSDGSTAYSDCGQTLPSEFSGGPAYFNGGTMTWEQTNFSTTWSNCVSSTIQPAYNSSGQSCGSGSYIEADLCGDVTSP